MSVSEKANPVATEMFEKMRKAFLEKVSDEDREKYMKFGERFYNSFDVNTGTPIQENNAGNPVICMEEALAYVVESLKSGLHPSRLTYDEAMIVKAGYGDQWYEKWGYTVQDIPSELLQ
jgi:hypothetical protein|uniref:Uncharacterized protein n=1 Tax=viral metagenome TaxID=1070528 RepID=A0A6C0K5A9_9ZZZZ